MPEHDWLSAHLFSHGDLDRLLTELVTPLVGELAAAGLTGRYFYLRYWDGGSHVRLRLHAPAAKRAEIRRLVDERSARFFRSRPATTTVRPADYARQAAALARRERVADYARTPYPNNSLRFIPYRREHHRYGHGPSMEAVERHFVECSRICLRLVGSRLTPDQRAAVAAAVLLLSWAVAGRSPHRPEREDAHATRPGAAPPAGQDPQDLEARYARQRAALLRMTARMHSLASPSQGVGGGSAFARWAASLAGLRDALESHGRPALPTIDLCAHLTCNRLGIPPAEESYLRYLAARARAESANEER